MTDARLVKTVALMVEDDRPRRRPARRSDDIAERCAVTVTVTVTVTEALVMRPLLEDRGRITESIRIGATTVGTDYGQEVGDQYTIGPPT